MSRIIGWSVIDGSTVESSSGKPLDDWVEGIDTQDMAVQKKG